MKIVVLGSGLMGPAAAFVALADAEVSEVLLCDMSQAQLAAAQAKLSRLPGGARLRTLVLDLEDQAAACEALAGAAAVVAALPKTAIVLGIRAALAAGVPLVDLSWPPDPEVPAIRQEVIAAGGQVILGCGVEPGLTEIMARYLAEKLDRVEELHIKCGGIPAHPAPPLGYKIVFGGRQLPLRDFDGYMVENGELQLVGRYTGVEEVTFPDVGVCEAWHENFMPWLLDLAALQGLRTGTQKTVRWAGYAARVGVLKELGLLSQEPIDVGGVQVAPKDLLDTLLYPYVRLNEGEQDITVLRVEVMGTKDGRPRSYKIEMVDRYDLELGFTSMARTTAFTGALVACMVARGEIQARGWLTPEQVITGPLFERLISQLAERELTFAMSTEQMSTLR